MTSIRLWIALLALTSFFAGMAGGILLAKPRGGHLETSPFAAYEARLTESFGLDEARMRWLRLALEEYDSELEALKSRGVASLEDELVQAGRRCHERIRLYVVPEASREEFDRFAAGVPLPTDGLH